MSLSIISLIIIIISLSSVLGTLLHCYFRDRQSEHRILHEPLSHVSGCGIMMVTFHNHETLHIMPEFEVEVYLRCVAEFRVGSAIGSDTLIIYQFD